MANFLDALLMGAQGASGMAPQVNEAEEIMVTGTPQRPREIPEDYRSVPSKKQKPKQYDETPELIRRRGRFGVGGTLRDILGTIGDAYLMSNGRAPVYHGQREKEKLASAQYGFTEDPLGAAERVGELDADASRDLWKTAEAIETNRSTRQSQSDAREAQVADRKYKMTQDFGNYAARLLAAADTPAKQAEALKILSQRAMLYGLDLDELGLGGELTEDRRATLAAGDMTVNQQQQIPFTERRVRAQESQAESSRIRANRPPAPRAQPNPTAASIIAPLADKIRRGETLTPGEQKIYDDLRPSRGRSQRQVPALPPGFSR